MTRGPIRLGTTRIEPESPLNPLTHQSTVVQTVKQVISVFVSIPPTAEAANEYPTHKRTLVVLPEQGVIFA